ncbi:MAG: EAL domain-containing protein [Eubacterium sp.]|nr:EAL domain-containing protein [Eubacterium sp.]
MDDFGSGFSSPDFLQKVPFDTVKFDMQFMRNFDSGEKSRIILTELIKLMIALGLETVVEGVETMEQVEFLREIGCTKLQGFYYSKPIPVEEIMSRYKNGSHIGFENPSESAYYEVVGKLNLYDLSFIVEGSENLQNYFETMPICVVEYSKKGITAIRSNTSHKKFIEKQFPDLTDPNNTNQGTLAENSVFMRGIRQCSRDGRNVVIAQRAADGTVIHVLIKRIADNPVSGASAFVCIGLSDRLLR